MVYILDVKILYLLTIRILGPLRQKQSLDAHQFKLYMDSTAKNNGILMRLTNNALYSQQHIVIISVVVMIFIDINEYL